MKKTNNLCSYIARALCRTLFLTGVLTMIAMSVSAGVLVAPVVVFMEESSRTGRLNVENPGDTPAEVEISFGWGLEESDSLGNIRVQLRDSAVTDPRSALGWVKAFPRKIVIPAGGKQVVRLVARPPKSLPEGEYWARIIVRSKDVSQQLVQANSESGISTQLNMVMQTVLTLKYRNGDMVTNVELVNSKATSSDSIVQVMLDLANGGNASYIGTLTCRLLDANNKEVSNNSVALAVYRTLRRRVELPITGGDFSPPYRVEVSISNDGRHDIARDDLILGNRITQMIAVQTTTQ